MSAQWPNEPNPFTLINDWGHNSIVGNGWTDVYNTTGFQTTIVSDATAPLSPNNVLQQRFPAGLIGGNGGGGGNTLYFGTTYPNVYWGFWMKVPVGFQNHHVATKIGWLHTRKGNTPSTNELFFGLVGSGSYYIDANYQNTDTDNSHMGGGVSGTIKINPSGGGGGITAGQWFRFETYFQPSTSPTSRNGVWKVWVDGVNTINVTNMNTQRILPDAVSHITIWGGTGGTMTNNNFLYWDHSRVSYSPGGAPLPPPQVVLESLTPATASTTVGGTRQFTISMSGAMSTATSLFTNSSNPSAATVPASVTIAQGASTAVFDATGVAIGSTTISTNYNSVTKGATLQVTATPTTGGSTTTYTYATDFSSTQGPNWYYLEDNGTQMTYVPASSFWRGSDTVGGSVQLIWGTGFHPGGSRPTMLRFIVPLAGSAQITGAFYDVDTGGGVGCVTRVNHNGGTLFTRTIANGDSTGGAYDVTATVVVGDRIDFVVSNITSDYSNNSTNLNPVIVITPATSNPDPTTEPEPPISVVDLFTATTIFIVGVPFTAAVRLSKTVTVDTAVQILVGSTSILTAPTSVTVPASSNEQTFTITPIGTGQVTVDAILTATKRMTISVQPVHVDPDPGQDPDPDGGEPLPGQENPVTVTSLTVTPEGATVVLSRQAKALAFAYTAKPDWTLVSAFSAATTFTHSFTWPSGTVSLSYRAQANDGTWGPHKEATFQAPKPPPVRPIVNKAIIDGSDVKWQLTGKTSPYTLKRNGSKMDNTYGVTLRKSGDGYMEILQTNGVWLRRNGDAWEFVE
jgi:hypothetical protein